MACWRVAAGFVLISGVGPGMGPVCRGSVDLTDDSCIVFAVGGRGV